MGKTVNFSQRIERDDVIRACCAEAGRAYKGLPAIRLGAAGEALELGYVLESSGCECASRWIPYNWRKRGHAEFVART